MYSLALSWLRQAAKMKLNDPLNNAGSYCAWHTLQYCAEQLLRELGEDDVDIALTVLHIMGDE
jgi:hypothetical protein